MSRIAKWKLEKTKVKVVFRLQFHATHIPQTGWDKLFISFIPSDSGKATAKTTKATARNGTCKWGDPIYETTRLLQDVKSKQYDEKLYTLIVAMGSSRASILGEATINLADYADALKPSAVSLPLHGCNFGTVLHVTVQLLTSKTGFREFEQQRELRERGLQSGAESKHDDGSPGKDATSSQLDKVNARVRFKDAKELTSFEEEVGSREESMDSALGFDDSSNTSESLYAEKHDSSSVHEINSLRSTVTGDLNGLSHCQGQQTGKGDLSDKSLMVQGTGDSVRGWPSDGSVDNDMIYEENHRLRGSLELAESTIAELKQEISSLQNQANDIGIETHKFSNFLASEISSSEEMANELSILKSECLKFKDEIERLKDFKMNPQVTGREGSLAEHHHLLQDRQLRWTNGILNLENRIKELLQKTYLGFHERDIRFLPSELEELLRILQGIKQGTGEATSLLDMVPSERTDVDEMKGTLSSKNELLTSGTELDLDLSLPESLLHHLSIPPLVSQETDSIGAIDVMKRKTFDLMRELDEAKAERENLARKMDQMECYYEALIQELEENQKQMLGELQNLRNEHSTCLYTISSSKAEMESMRQNMNQQLLQLAEERRDLDAVNKELERRATTSEAALRRARLNYSIAVDKLQKDLELLSSQVVSMFETNENIINQAFPESPQTQSLGYLDMLQNPGYSEDASLMQCQNPVAGVRKQPLGGEILLEDLKKSLYLQEELYQKVEGELHELQFVNLYLDIFSKTLQETFFEANAEIGHMKGNLNELAQHLELSNVAQDQLVIRLQSAMEDIRLLNDYKASCIAKFSDMALENQTLEAKLEIITEENSHLLQKVADYETFMSENRSYQKIYEACCAEKAELSKLLKQENTENVKLQNEISRLKEELKISKAELAELSLLKDDLQENVSFVRDKLASMLISYDQQFKGLNLLSSSHDLDLEGNNNLKSAILLWEEMQRNACSRIFELMEEKKTLDFERALSETSLSAARSDILAIKKKLKSDIQKMAAKLDGSNALIGKLQFDLESVANKLQLSSQVEENYAQQNNELLADLNLFEVELKQLISKSGLLTQEILVLEDLAEELGTSKSTVAELTQEKQGLWMSVQDKIQETVKLASERDCLAENLRTLNHELQVERVAKDKLEGTFRDLTSQLNKMQEKFLEYEQKQAELVHFRQLSSDLELEKSELNHLLLLRDDCLEKLREESSCLYHFQTQLLEMEDYMLAADIKFTYLLYQYETVCQDFVQQIRSSDGCLEELQKRHHEVEAMLNHSLVSEARYREENIKLTGRVGSLQSDLEAVVAQNKFSSEANDDLRVQIEEYKKKLEMLEDGYNKDKNQHAIEIDQLRNLLASAEEENVKLASTVKSLQSDLEASVAQNKFPSEANDVLLVQLEEYKKRLEVLEAGYNNDSDDLVLQLEQLRNLLANAEEENVKLASAVKSLQSDLEASVAQNKFSSEANDVLRVQLEEYRKKLDVLEDGYNKDKDDHALQIDQLRDSLANAEEENVNLATTVRSLQSDLEASVAQNKFSSEANDILRFQLEEYRKLEALEDGYNKDKDHQALQVEQLRNLLANAEEENIELMRTVKLLQSDLEASVAQNTSSAIANNVTKVQLEEYKKLKALEDDYNKAKDHHALQVRKLRNLMANAEEEIDFLTSSIQELEITITVLKDKLDEQSASISLMEEYEKEIQILQSQCNELTHKLSEQVLRTEEFKNLSIHLKELKDKAEAECLQVREKRQPGGSPVMQESLRIAFIKEQYETRVQELRQQLSISKKHGEELLFKLQDAIDEIENRKKSEALHLKRNDELSLKLVELESDLRSALSEKCEKINAYDRINAELECTVLTLECCKEEKENLEASLRECKEEKNKIAIELTRTKGHLENGTSSIKIHREENGGMNKTGHSQDESTGNLLPRLLMKDGSVYGEKVEHVSPSQDGDCKDLSMALKGQALQEAVNRGSRGISESALLGGVSQRMDGKDVSNARLNSIKFRSSMEHLQEELERMKNENSLLSMDPEIGPDFQVLQAELNQLHNATEELRNIFPSFDKISSSGNALVRVLALVIELAESLRARSKSNIHFQSSFLKQHSDEEAVLRSFRDIHELIKEMLDLKGRYAALENDLKEMHDRYSQLSLQFAEVEGERQKLKMTLKNVRASKKLYLNRSSSSALEDHSP